MDRFKQISYLFLSICLITTLSACGGGGGSGTATLADNTPNTVTPADVGDTQTASSVPTQDVTLSWVAPTTREDGTPISLSEISGYRIYYNLSPDGSVKSVSVPASGSLSVTLDGLSSGQYVLKMTTIDTSGLESGYSSPVTISI